MDLYSPAIIKNLLSKYGAKALKSLGQNFLIDKNILDKMVLLSDIKKEDNIVEVGPGLGVLTVELAQRAKQVICIEKDKKMVEILKENTKDYSNITIVHADILKTNLSLYIESDYKLIANIPYNITAPLIRFFLENDNPPKEIILMVQKEVAQRICAKPPKMSLLAVSVQYYAETNILFYVSKHSFLPSPKVDSAVIKIIPHHQENSSRRLFEVVKAGFSQPRKQLVNNLTSLKNIDGVKLDKQKVSEWLLKNNIRSNQRAETLSIQDWLSLAKNL